MGEVRPYVCHDRNQNASTSVRRVTPRSDVVGRQLRPSVRVFQIRIAMELRMTRRLAARLPELPRLDFTLLVFALTGLGLALLVPQGPSGKPARPGSYAIAITSGDDLKLSARSATSAVQELDSPASQRVLACSNVMSVGGLDIGARCTSGARSGAGPSSARLARGD